VAKVPLGFDSTIEIAGFTIQNHRTRAGRLQMKRDYWVRGIRCSVGSDVAIAIVGVSLFVTGAHAASTEAVLHTFNSNSKDGNYPQGGHISDAAGNFYGTTENGGSHQQGTVFEVMPKAGGGWMEKVLHNFNLNGKDGYEPSSSLIRDAAGSLYGTTYAGGAHDCGTVFQLTPERGGVWMERILHSFNANGKDGTYPNASLIFDHSGNLYSTTVYGGADGGGTVFELTPRKGGVWTEKILHTFIANGEDGFYPVASLIFDAAGNLYGTTAGGGVASRGTVFELTPKTWTEKELYSFNGNSQDGDGPQAGMVLDADGNLYGTTIAGGADGGGTAFEVTPGAGTEKVLYNFNSNSQDGSGPQAGLIFDATGNLYGTTVYGGAGGYGTVFKIMP
jgi:uncharacterized repeat protein (TIGR03803 family)